jgi:hypothetical protein
VATEEVRTAYSRHRPRRHRRRCNPRVPRV